MLGSILWLPSDFLAVFRSKEALPTQLERYHFFVTAESIGHLVERDIVGRGHAVIANDTSLVQ